ncbi:6042_t:CDS:2 [Racocetra persica]|uniref:6042_t:CDS:1 n=1 Tax=Racocetra persica TaxID=160502 RepID=A0ACA9MUG1_9GLOM|nr:6042_t:CDS:2 [Racocetra persica]
MHDLDPEIILRLANEHAQTCENALRCNECQEVINYNEQYKSETLDTEKKNYHLHCFEELMVERNRKQETAKMLKCTGGCGKEELGEIKEGNTLIRRFSFTCELKTLIGKDIIPLEHAEKDIYCESCFAKKDEKPTSQLMSRSSSCSLSPLSPCSRKRLEAELLTLRLENIDLKTRIERLEGNYEKILDKLSIDVDNDSQKVAENRQDYYYNFPSPYQTIPIEGFSGLESWGNNLPDAFSSSCNISQINEESEKVFESITKRQKEAEMETKLHSQVIRDIYEQSERE